MKSKSTAASISVDSIEKLNPLLRKEEVMVFRLGSSRSGTGTQFSLVRPGNGLKEYFLFDEEIFTNKAQTYIPSASYRDLFSFKLIPKLSESSLVSLGLASGLIAEALELDGRGPILSPSTSKGTFSFETKLSDKLGRLFVHDNGQVEIDSLFISQRQGRDALYVMESKHAGDRSIAKHKLVYPILSICSNVPSDIEIIPVYIKSESTSTGINYKIAICDYKDPRIYLTSIESLTVKTSISYNLIF